jgi:tetratricopeptide (TPR) repeat protein
LNDGKWNGKKIVPETWVKESIKSYAPEEERIGFGYCWWIHSSMTMYAAEGWGGHALMIFPKQDLIIVHRTDAYIPKPVEWEEYTEGLSIDPNNTHLLTDYGTYFMSQYYGLKEAGHESDALTNLESAITYLDKSFKVDNSDQNTTYKLSICYWLKGDCDEAWEFYDTCKKLGGQPITEEYTSDLKRNAKDVSESEPATKRVSVSHAGRVGD